MKCLRKCKKIGLIYCAHDGLRRVFFGQESSLFEMRLLNNCKKGDWEKVVRCSKKDLNFIP